MYIYMYRNIHIHIHIHVQVVPQWMRTPVDIAAHDQDAMAVTDLPLLEPLPLRLKEMGVTHLFPVQQAVLGATMMVRVRGKKSK